ncbi:hypothetical protein ACFL2V_12765 [Pseudomonadota bacterium]
MEWVGMGFAPIVDCGHTLGTVAIAHEIISGELGSGFVNRVSAMLGCGPGGHWVCARLDIG